jgi:hypothetical protein
MPSRLDPKIVIAEVQELHADVDQRMLRILELSESLYDSVRRGDFRRAGLQLEADVVAIQGRLEWAVRHHQPPEVIQNLHASLDRAKVQLAGHDEIAPVYALYANAWRRLASSMYQGGRRMASVNRMVSQVQQKQGLTVETAPPTPKDEPPSPTEAVEDLLELYGEDTVNYAG